MKWLAVFILFVLNVWRLGTDTGKEKKTNAHGKPNKFNGLIKIMFAHDFHKNKKIQQKNIFNLAFHKFN